MHAAGLYNRRWCADSPGLYSPVATAQHKLTDCVNNSCAIPTFHKVHSSLFTLIVLLVVYLQGGMPLKHQQAGGSTLQVNATHTAFQVHFEHSICIWPQC